MSTTATNVKHEIKLITDEDRRRHASEVYSCGRSRGCDCRPEYWLILKNLDGSKRRRSPACREHAAKYAVTFGLEMPEGDN